MMMIVTKLRQEDFGEGGFIQVGDEVFDGVFADFDGGPAEEGGVLVD